MCPVGEPIVAFKSTRELVEVIRDAIKGHKALMDCGLLHGDISASNILLATNEEYKGIIHDLDYSNNLPKWDKFSGGPSEIPKYTGTYKFMARDIMDGMSQGPMHDLESFFWLLAWASFRHVKKSFVDHFDMPKAAKARMLKLGWLCKLVLIGWKEIEVEENRPLTQLLIRLASLLLFDSRGMGHDNVLPLFEEALNSEWPDYQCTSFVPSKCVTVPHGHRKPLAGHGM
ncbi:hypothetical protein F5887DRAFT_892569 [Amanita rubescens]|nr:hypothetical protein F5887DRAFT_909017 [Amanita rubescens]KAF8334545.1 hypothetical protein F5887DRAFT_892569 [Amanita rubescens]